MMGTHYISRDPRMMMKPPLQVPRFPKRSAIRAAVILVAAGSSLVGWSVSAHADSALAWEQWQHLPGVVDIVGPRADGKLVASAEGSLFLVSADGGISPFSAGNRFSTSKD